jgi:hypothetical protein
MADFMAVGDSMVEEEDKSLLNRLKVIKPCHIPAGFF